MTKTYGRQSPDGLLLCAIVHLDENAVRTRFDALDGLRVDQNKIDFVCF